MLKINRNDNCVRSVKFSNIKVGGLFTHDDFDRDDDNSLLLLMKIGFDEVDAKCCEDSHNAISLDDGEAIWISEDDEVNPIIADLKIISGKTTY
jgi:hypothetical protein